MTTDSLTPVDVGFDPDCGTILLFIHENGWRGGVQLTGEQAHGVSNMLQRVIVELDDWNS